MFSHSFGGLFGARTLVANGTSEVGPIPRTVPSLTDSLEAAEASGQRHLRRPRPCLGARAGSVVRAPVPVRTVEFFAVGGARAVLQGRTSGTERPGRHPWCERLWAYHRCALHRRPRTVSGVPEANVSIYRMIAVGAHLRRRHRGALRRRCLLRHHRADRGHRLQSPRAGDQRLCGATDPFRRQR